MAAIELKPGGWIPGWVESGGTISMPVASFPKMVTADAHADTGDIRKVLFAICEVLYQAYDGVPVADRPVQMQVWKTASIAANTGEVQKSYGFRFECDSETTVKAEPAAE